MGKRLTLSDYIFTLLFIVMLVCAVGAFFYGVEVGKKRSAAKYEELLAVKRAENHELQGYHQQYLVSFYHTVFLPYREFQKEWFEAADAVESGREKDAKSFLKKIAAAANREYETMKTAYFPEHTTYLTDAHTKYLQSLKLFAMAADKFSPNGKSGPDLIEAVNRDAFFREAKQYALNAQSDFYTAISLWHESMDPTVRSDAAVKRQLSFKEWSALGINHKNRFVAAWLAEKGQFGNYYPQDLTLRIDEMFALGNASKMDMDEVTEVAQTLIDTRAVRFGDFIAGKDKYYADELFPQLSFFYSSD